MFDKYRYHTGVRLIPTIRDEEVGGHDEETEAQKLRPQTITSKGHTALFQERISVAVAFLPFSLLPTLPFRIELAFRL